MQLNRAFLIQKGTIGRKLMTEISNLNPGFNCNFIDVLKITGFPPLFLSKEVKNRKGITFRYFP